MKEELHSTTIGQSGPNQDWPVADEQGRYLAEAVYLDSIQPEQIVDGIKRYIERYVSHHFANDHAKHHAMEQLCRDASSLHANEYSEALSQLLSDQQIGIHRELPDEATSLHNLKNVEIPKRIGDVIFLPPDAEVIVIGDTHGDLTSTQNIIANIYNSGAIARGAYVVFLGDYVNNGMKSWQNLIEILRFRRKHPMNVVLLSGNHEFKESYITALNEYFNVHWERFSADDLPPNLQDRLPQNDNHYGHMRLDLARSFGFEEGERLYAKCSDWGLSLPCICVSGNLMISHSLGKLEEDDVELPELLHCKQNDIQSLKQMGFETWNAQRQSLHSALVNNRTMTAELLAQFNRALDVSQFVVGHCHYRSGDTLHFGSNSVTTIVSSEPTSPDSGHYMYQQMIVERDKKRLEENLTQYNATAGYLSFAMAQNNHGSRTMTMNKIFM